MKIHYLVPFAEKDAAKALGARRDPQARLWFAATAEASAALAACWPVVPDPSPISELPGEDRAFGDNDLFVDLVPTTCWFTNVRSCVDPAYWDRLSMGTRQRANMRCEVCGQGQVPETKVYLEAHERWHYDFENKIQTLRRIITLCTPCHLVTHWGYARVSGREELANAHFKQVAGIDEAEVQRRVVEAMELWSARSQVPWSLDLSIITQAGIPIVKPVAATDRVGLSLAGLA